MDLHYISASLYSTQEQNNVSAIECPIAILRAVGRTRFDLESSVSSIRGNFARHASIIIARSELN